MEHYKSWSGLKKWLENNLCEELRGRISFFLTRYHEVHNAYGRASIRVDGEEWVIFSWIEMYHQERDMDRLWCSEDRQVYNVDRYQSMMKPEWDDKCTYCEHDFLSAVLRFRNMTIKEALGSEEYIIKVLAILDGRVGRRTLRGIGESEEYQNYPGWVKQFYLLRMGA